jgi:uncharacterized protein (DUF58 family)
MIKITKTGWIYVLLTIFMGFAAINTNNNLVFIVVSFMLSVMGISGFLGKSNLDNLRFSFFPQDEIYAQKLNKIDIIVSNDKKYLPSVLLTIKVLGNTDKIIYLNNNQKATVTIFFTPAKRGLVHIKELEISSPYPFNFFVRRKKYTINEEILVFPHISNNLFESYEVDIKGDDLTNDKLTHKLEELSNIRAYSNDPSRRIFWKQFAKTDNLYTKEYTGDEERSLYIRFEEILHIFPLEDALSIAASTIVYGYKNSIRIVFSIGDKMFPPLTSPQIKRSILKELSLYGEPEKQN